MPQKRVVSPETYGLNKRIELRVIDLNHFAIVKKIKSRIIQNDALKILDMVRKMKDVDPTLHVDLVCTRNICSKSIKLLRNNNVELIFEDIEAVPIG